LLLALLELVVQLAVQQERRAALQHLPGQFLILFLQHKVEAVVPEVKARPFLPEVVVAV
jgi:hypothetical protein